MRGFAVGVGLFSPLSKFELSGAAGFFDAADVERALESGVMSGIFRASNIATSNERDLVSKVRDLVIDGGSGEEKDLGVGAGLDDVFEESLVAGASGGAIVFFRADGVVAEVV